MPLNKDWDGHAPARDISAATGAPKPRRLADRLDEIADHCAALPVRRDRSINEILGYADGDRDVLFSTDRRRS